MSIHQTLTVQRSGGLHYAITSCISSAIDWMNPTLPKASDVCVVYMTHWPLTKSSFHPRQKTESGSSIIGYSGCWSTVALISVSTGHSRKFLRLRRSKYSFYMSLSHYLRAWLDIFLHNFIDLQSKICITDLVFYVIFFQKCYIPISNFIDLSRNVAMDRYVCKKAVK